MANGARDRLEEILNRREYQIYYEDTRSLLQRIKDWFQGLISKILEKLFPALESTTNISSIIVTILVILVVVILGIVLYRITRNRRIRRQYQKSIPLQNLHEMEWTSADHFSMAKRKEEKAEYEQAIRHLFLAMLLYYDEIDWVKAQIWKTNWEYYAELTANNRQGAESFNHLARLFDEVAYGKQNVSVNQYEAYAEEVEKAYTNAKSSVMSEKEE